MPGPRYILVFFRFICSLVRMVGKPARRGEEEEEEEEEEGGAICMGGNLLSCAFFRAPEIRREVKPPRSVALTFTFAHNPSLSPITCRPPFSSQPRPLLSSPPLLRIEFHPTTSHHIHSFIIIITQGDHLHFKQGLTHHPHERTLGLPLLPSRRRHLTFMIVRRSEPSCSGSLLPSARSPKWKKKI